MGDITRDDMRQMARQLGLTNGDVSSPVRPDTIKAQCNRCGTCCKTQPGIVLSLCDIFRISGRLDIRPKVFIRKYCQDSRAYDIFGQGPFPGISIATRNGICPFYKAQSGCTINDVKPEICRLYPFNTLHVTRASLLKMQRMKDGECYKGCYVFGFGNHSVLVPDFDALAAYHIRMFVTREYFTRSDGQWHDDLARKARDNSLQLAGNDKTLETFVLQMRAAFEDFDRRNAEMLAEAIK
ncbi:MAG TPA: YkgJ family cysteine cluster protein [Methanocella sp.]|jgi:Fe-S-cluster containining protein